MLQVTSISGPCVFQQDNAKPHTAGITKACGAGLPSGLKMDSS